MSIREIARMLSVALLFLEDRIIMKILLVFLTVIAEPSASPNLHWERISQGGPGPRLSHAMVYDPTLEKIILLGGIPADPLKGESPPGTWTWDGTVWTRVADSGPQVADDMVYDEQRKRIVAVTSRTESKFLETWEWDGASWTKVPADGPPVRSSFAMTYDPKRKRMVLFGGRCGSDYFGDTWEYPSGSDPH